MQDDTTMPDADAADNIRTRGVKEFAV
ncbi:MAG TPA: siderophore biosynthesis protein, partial [Afipia sp.]|nr:siderophore biosynthesis protein [Afipia sp.]